MKAYVKPELFLEIYELSQHVAACRWDLNQGDKDTCEAYYDNYLDNQDHESLSLFTQKPRCNLTPDQVEDYCYTNGAATSRTFMS